MNYIQRTLEPQINDALAYFPVVALLGARQVGKSTLAKQILLNYKNAIYLDLELDSDLNKISDSELFFRANQDKLICIDEIQRKPELFSLIRAIVDKTNNPGQFLVLGSASRDLIKQSNETLAGRISYYTIQGLSIYEILTHRKISADYPNKIFIEDYLIKGGYPKSYLAPTIALSHEWNRNYIETYLERDIPNLGFNIPAPALKRLLLMLANEQGQTLNASRLGKSLGLSSVIIKHYLDLFEQTFILRQLKPYFNNGSKRIVKSPKLYIRDQGLVNELLKIDNFNDFLGRSICGSIYEGMVVENLIHLYSDYEPYYYRTSNGAEIDLLLVKGNKKIAVDIKLSTSPKPTRGFYNAIKDMGTNIDEVLILGETLDDYTINGYKVSNFIRLIH